MADTRLKEKIKTVLKQGYFCGPDDAVFVSDGSDDEVHVVIVSEKLGGKRLKEKNDLIWSELTRYLDSDEWQKVTLSIGHSPEEIKAF